MPTIQEVRDKYPQYHDMSDEALADALHGKYYTDMPKEEFYGKIGLAPAAQEQPGFIDRAVGNYNAAVNEGVNNMSEGAASVVAPDSSMWQRAKGAGQAALGGLEYVTSPINAASKTLVGDPTKNTALGLGAPAPVAEFLGNSADIAGQMVGGAGVAKAVPELARAATAVGQAAAPVVRELGAVPGALRNRVAPSPTAPLTGEVAQPPAGLMTTSKAAQKADDVLYQHLIDSGWTPARVEAKLKQLGPGATMADLEPFAGIAETTAQFPQGAKNANRVLGGRDVGTAQRMLTTVGNTLSPENYYKSLDYLRATRSNEAQPLRQAAMDSAAGKPIKSDLIQRLQKDSPYFNQAMSEGKKIAKEEAAREGIEIPTTETWFHGDSFDDPNIKTMHEPTLRMLDAAKQGYQALLKPYRDKYTGIIDKTDPTAVELSKTVEALTDTMRKASPTYGKYLDAWSEHSQQMDALARGRKILSNDPEVTAGVIRRATPNEKMDMQTGLARALTDKINENPQAALRYFDKSGVQGKMQALFPSKYEWNLFRRQTLREAQKRSTYLRNTKGSQTTERVLGAQNLDNAVQGPSAVPEAAKLGMNVLSGNKIGVGKQIAGWLYRKATNTPTEPVANEISSVLHNADPVMQERQIQRFKQRSMPTMPPRGVNDIPMDEDAFP